MEKNWVESLKEWFERKSGRIYSTYTILFIVTNWKFFYVLFLSSSNHGGDRIKEALGEFVTRTTIPWSEYYLMQFLFPAALTIFVIEFLTPLNNWAYKKYIDGQSYRLLEKAKRDADVADKIADIKRDELSSYEDAGELQQQINDLLAHTAELQTQLEHESSKGEISKEGEWERDLEEHPEIISSLKAINDVVYQNNGKLSKSEFDGFKSRTVRIISPGDLKTADTFGLIKFNDPEKKTITLTPKAQYYNKKV